MDSPEDATNFRMKQTYVGGDVMRAPSAVVRRPAPVCRSKTSRSRAAPASTPSIETVHTPATAPGLGANPAYLHLGASGGIDTPAVPGLRAARRLYGLTYHNYADRDDTYSFDRLDAEIVQHIPILRENWVISLHGLLQTTLDDDDTVPYLPAAVARQRQHAARLLRLALSRSAPAC